MDKPQKAIETHPISRHRLWGFIFMLGLVSTGWIIFGISHFFGDYKEDEKQIIFNKFFVSLLISFIFFLPSLKFFLMMKMSIIRYAGGLVFKKGNHEDFVKWEDIQEIDYKEVIHHAYGKPIQQVNEDNKPLRNLFVNLKTLRGKNFKIDNFYKNCDTLYEFTVSNVVANLLWRTSTLIENGDTVTFGHLLVDKKGITIDTTKKLKEKWWCYGWKKFETSWLEIRIKGQGSISFLDIQSVSLNLKSTKRGCFYEIVIRDYDNEKPWAEIPVLYISNVAVFCELLAKFGLPIKILPRP